MNPSKITFMIFAALAFSLTFSMCTNSGGSCIFRPEDDDDDDNDDESDMAFTCGEFCKNAFFCDLVPSTDQCYTICMGELSYAFIECGYEADVDCAKFRLCFEEYGDEFTGGDDDDDGLECDYEAPSVEDVCDYPEFSFYAGELTSGECSDTCYEAEDYGYLTSYDGLCGYCFCCGYEDLL